MLRNHRCGEKRCLRRQNCVQKADDETQSKGKNDTGNNYTQKFKSSEHCQIPWLL